MTELKPHPLAEMFPRPSADDLEYLQTDIVKHGQHMPIVIFENKILDGLTRYRTCIQKGIKPKLKPFIGTDRQALEYVVSMNMCRRHLTQAQKAAVGAEITRRLVNSGMSHEAAVHAACCESRASASSIKEIERIAEESPRIAKKVLNGKLSIAAAKREVTESTEQDIIRRYIMQARALLISANRSISETDAPRSIQLNIRSTIRDLEDLLATDWISE